MADGGVTSWLLPHGLINDVSKINDYASSRGAGKSPQKFFVLYFGTFLLFILVFVIISSYFKPTGTSAKCKFIYLHASFAILIFF